MIIFIINKYYITFRCNRFYFLIPKSINYFPHSPNHRLIKFYPFIIYSWNWPLYYTDSKYRVQHTSLLRNAQWLILITKFTTMKQLPLITSILMLSSSFLSENYVPKLWSKVWGYTFNNYFLKATSNVFDVKYFYCSKNLNKSSGTLIYLSSDIPAIMLNRWIFYNRNISIIVYILITIINFKYVCVFYYCGFRSLSWENLC